MAARAEALKNAAARKEYGNLPAGTAQDSKRARENLERLRRPGCVAVLADLYPGLFGGPASQLFKCLTAVKICMELDRHAMPAVPVCMVRREIPCGFPRSSARLLDGEYEICSYALDQDADPDLPIGDVILKLLDRVEASANFDPETVRILRSCYRPEATLTGATSRLIPALLQEWGVVVADPLSIRLPGGRFARTAPGTDLAEPALRYAALPVAAVVLDSFEAEAFAAALPRIREHGLPVPAPWPRASASLCDRRSRRILDRYGLVPGDLFEGADAVVERLSGMMPRDVPEALRGLKEETLAAVAGLHALPAAAGRRLHAAGSGGERIVFQLDRLRERFETARAEKDRILRRQVRRVCNFLAPDRNVQESEMACIQWPLRYSLAGLRSVYEKLDIMNPEHQLVEMD